MMNGESEEGICSVTMLIEGLTLPYGAATLIGWAEIGRSWIPDLALLARNDGKRRAQTRHAHAKSNHRTFAQSPPGD